MHAPFRRCYFDNVFALWNPIMLRISREDSLWHPNCEEESEHFNPPTFMNSINEPCIKVCNSLLRGELSAVETYSEAIRKHADSPAARKLREIRDEHLASAQLLRENVLQMDGEPESDSGSWGVFAKGVQGAANLFGADSAVASLQHGEETGLSDYEDALQDDDVIADCKMLIRDRLLPAIERHIFALESLHTIA